MLSDSSHSLSARRKGVGAISTVRSKLLCTLEFERKDPVPVDGL